MNIIWTLAGIAKLALFCLFVGVVIGFSLHARVAALQRPTGRPAAPVAPQHTDAVPGYRGEVSGWKLTRS
jgi:hypothetical protein